MGKLNSTTVDQALAETGGNKLQAAKKLNVAPSTLRRFLNKVKTQPGTPVPTITEAAETAEAQPA